MRRLVSLRVDERERERADPGPPLHAVALALRAQMVQDGEEIPLNEWDRLVDVLVTPDGEIK